MNLWKGLVIVLFVLLVGVVLYQQSQISKLERSIGDLSSTALTGTDTQHKLDHESLTHRQSVLEDSVNHLIELALEPAAGYAGDTTSGQSSAGRSTSDLTGDKGKSGHLQALGEKREEKKEARADNREERQENREEKKEARQENVEERVDGRVDKKQSAADEKITQFIAQEGLSEEQAKALTGLVEAERRQAEAVFQSARDGEKNLRESRKEMKGVRDNTDQAVSGVLNEAQFAAWLQLRKDLGGILGR